MSFVTICGILWHPVCTHIQLVPDNSECTQWLSSSLATSAAEHVCTPRIICSGLATVESHALYLPVFMVLHIIHTPSPTGATHITHKNQNTLHTSKSAIFQQTIHLQSDVLMLHTHSCTMTQSTCADYMLKSAVLWYYFTLDMLLPYFLKLPCVPVRGRKLKIQYKEHIHNRKYKWDVTHSEQ